MILKKILSFKDKMLSFTNSSRRKFVKDFLGDDFNTIHGVIEHHSFVFYRDLIVPILGIIFLLILIYFSINNDFLLSKISNKEAYKAVKYLLIFWVLFLIYFIFWNLKTIYNVFVDHRNDFIVIFEHGIYISDKNGVFNHSQIKISFSSINTIKAIERNFLDSLLGTGSVFIKTVGDIGDVRFDYCKNIHKEVKKLRDLHSEYLVKDDIKGVFNSNPNDNHEKQ